MGKKWNIQMSMMKDVLVKKSLQTLRLSWKSIHGVEIHSSVKNKFWRQQSVKVLLTWSIKGPISSKLLEKDTTVNSISYCQLLRKKFTLFIELLLYMQVCVYVFTQPLYHTQKATQELFFSFSWILLIWNWLFF